MIKSIQAKYHKILVIEECQTKKYLGLIVDHKLNFNNHVDYIKKQIGE